MKIFMGFSEVAGFNSNLKKGFDELNIQSVLMTFAKHRFEYDIDKNKSLLRSYIQFIALQHSKRKFLYIFSLAHFFNKIFIFLWALSRYNVFIFSHHASFFNFFELPILKFFNKKIIYLFFGTDARAPYISGANVNTDTLTFDCMHALKTQDNEVNQKKLFDCVEVLTKKIFSKNLKVQKYADFIVNVPPQGHLFSKKMINAIYIGMPVKFDIIEEVEKSFDFSGTLKILHSPSIRKYKGSDEIAKIISELIDLGYKINYKEITGLPNSEVIKEIQNCDFLIDELYSDAPMSGIAKEAAYFSKPVVVSGYYSEYVNKDIKQEQIPPSFFVSPENLKDQLIKILKNKELIYAKGKEAKSYLNSRCEPKRVAQNFLKLINNDIPDYWFFDPSEITYIYGWGTPKDKLKIFLKQYVDVKGEEALYLEKSPKLKKLFLDFINE